MSIIDAFWNLSQEFKLDELRAAHSKARGQDAAVIEALQDENRELRIHLGILTRLLIQHGVISAEEYSSSVADTKAKMQITSTPRT
ncbi:MAG: hypothetical protein QM796_22685 [Chthoniobacteraceae bacterium]